MGLPAVGEVEEGHHAGVQGRLRAEYNRQETCDVCSVKPRPEGQDEEDRLFAASGQGMSTPPPGSWEAIPGLRRRVFTFAFFAIPQLVC